MTILADTAMLADYSSEWFSVLLDASFRATALLVIAGLAVMGLHRVSASARHLVWLLAVVGVLLLPLLTELSSPGWTVIGKADVKLTDRQMGTGPDGQTLVVSAVDEDAGTLSTADDPSNAHLVASAKNDLVPTFTKSVARSHRQTANGTSRRPGNRLATSILLVWALGAMLALVPAVAGRLSLWRLAKSSKRITGGSLAALLDQLSERLGLRRPVVLLQSGRRPMPMTWGVIKPKLLLPDEALGWTVERQRLVLLHELAHVKRRDCLAQLLSQIACALYWFHPLIWFVTQRMQTERERACDDRVLNSGLKASDYAE